MIANTISAAAVRAFVVKYWFQLCLCGLAVFIFLRKDLSFSISFRAPIDAHVKVPPASNSKLKAGLAQSESTTNQTSAGKNILPAEATSQKASIFSWGSSKGNIKESNHQPFNDGISKQSKRAFIERFLSIAQAESKKFQIPTSIILAQGILQTQAGENPLAEAGNNFFKIRANAGWHGKTYHAKTGIYRAYPSAWGSFRDHSEYITSGKFKNLVFSGSKNYAAWAAGLETFGFCKEPNYAKKLISIIESERLADYDN